MQPQPLSHDRKIGVLLICCMSLFMVGLDITVVNIALPSIGSDLHTGISGLQWTVSAYTVVMASLLGVMFLGLSMMAATMHVVPFTAGTPTVTGGSWTNSHGRARVSLPGS